MKIFFTGFFVSLLCFASNAHANVGVFGGYGHTIELASTKDIQMLSEEITIIPGRGPFLYDGGSGGMDRVEYDCVFVLKNLKSEKVTIQAGFPLNTEYLAHGAGNDVKASELVANYKFIAQIEGQQYTTRYVPGDKNNEFKNLFLWDMSFTAGESKTLRVTYTMPISMTLASSALDATASKYKKPWYRAFEQCMLEYFGYVTQTGKSWSGPIKKATFAIYIEGFEKYLYQRPIYEGLTGKDLKRARRKLLVWEPTVFRTLEPAGWIDNKNGFLELSFTDFKANQDLHFRYYILFFPRSEKDAKRMVSRLSERKFTKEDFEDLRDIMQEYNGKKTGTERIQKFLRNQVWYGKKPQQMIPDNVIKIIQSQC